MSGVGASGARRAEWPVGWVLVGTGGLGGWWLGGGGDCGGCTERRDRRGLAGRAWEGWDGGGVVKTNMKRAKIQQRELSEIYEKNSNVNSPNPLH